MAEGRRICKEQIYLSCKANVRWKEEMSMMEKIELTEENIEKMAEEVYNFLVENSLWYDTSILFNGKKMSAAGNGKDYSIEEDVDPNSILEHCNDEHILSMTFEGPLYGCLNCNYNVDYCDKISMGLTGIFNKYGCYYEMGHAWSLSLYLI